MAKPVENPTLEDLARIGCKKFAHSLIKRVESILDDPNAGDCGITLDAFNINKERVIPFFYWSVDDVSRTLILYFEKYNNRPSIKEMQELLAVERRIDSIERKFRHREG